MYIRFVIPEHDLDSGRRQGLFQALAGLDERGLLVGDAQARYRVAHDWFRRNLPTPNSFTRSSKPHAKKVALSWFKDSAVQHICVMRELAGILAAHDVVVQVLKTAQPGYVVYEDEFQVAAEPFSGTPT
jgi:hypothetical protein